MNKFQKSLLVAGVAAACSFNAHAWNPEFKARVLVLEDCSVDIPDLNTWSESRIVSLNNTLKRSGANLRFELAGTTRMLNYCHTDLETMYSDSFIRGLRSKFDADFVYMVTNRFNSPSLCGQAILAEYNDMAYAAGRPDSAFCTSSYTFKHEIGHNMGLNHTPKESHSFASGHSNWAWVTTMGIQGGTGGLIHKNVFSNPKKKCDAFYRCGKPNVSDAVRYINEDRYRYRYSYQ